MASAEPLLLSGEPNPHDNDVVAPKPIEREVNISPTRSYALFFTAVLTLCGSGPIFGWPSLYVALVREGIYASKCTVQELLDAGTCDSQSTSLNLIFTVSSFILVAMFMFWGTYLDYFGARKTIATAGTVFIISCGFLGIAFQQASEGAIFFGIILFASCGPGLFVPCMLINTSFPGKESTIIAVINSLFDASTLIFFLFQVVKLKLSVVFWAFGVLVFVFVFGTVWFWPTAPVVKSTPVINSDGEIQVEFDLARSFSLLGQRMMNEGDTSPPKPTVEKIDSGDVKDRPFKHQILSAECLFMLLFMILCSFRIVFYLGTVNEQLSMMSGGNPDTYVTTLGFMLPMCCFAVPIIGFLLDTKSMEVSFWALSVLGMLFHILCTITYLPVQVGTFLVFTTYRSFIYSAQSAYVGSVFGYLNFGRLMGVVNVCGGFFGLLQFPLLSASLAAGTFVPVNVCLLCLAVIAPFLPFFGYRYAANRRAKMKQQNMAATESLSGF